jgi:serine/threonine-protein kinase
MLAAGVGIGSFLPRRAEPERVRRLEVTLPEGLTLGELDYPVAVLAPDGARLAFVARSRTGRDQLYVRTFADGSTVAVPGTDGAFHPFFSPDGEWIGFAAGTFLKKVSVRGGAPVVICSAVVDFGAAWGDGDTIVFRTNAPGLLRVSASGGEPQRFTKENQSWPTFLPGGESVLVEYQRGIEVVSLETGESKRVVDSGRMPRYVETGHLVYQYEGSLYAANFDLDSLDVRGNAMPLDLGVRRTVSGPAQYDVAQDGSLVYLPGASSSTSEKALVWVERDGRFEPITESRRAFGVPRLSPDGQRIALWISEGQGLGDVFIYDVGRDVLQRVTLGGNSFAPVWSPDGTRITYSFKGNGGWSLLQRDADGSAEPDTLIEQSDFLAADAWSPDGTKLLYGTNVGDRSWDQLLFSVADGSSRTLASSPEYDAEASFSPDGRWIVYTSGESGVFHLYVQSLSETEKRWQISDSSGRDPIWTGGTEIVYRSGRRIMSVDVRTEPDFEASVPQILFEGPFELETSGFRNFDVTRDGQHFVLIQSDEAPLDRLTFVVNWLAEVERLAPR